MTKSVFYICGYIDTDEVFKMGITESKETIERRMKEHTSETSAYIDIVAKRAFVVEDAQEIETKARSITKEHSTTPALPRKEWRYTDGCLDDLLYFIEKIAIEEVDLSGIYSQEEVNEQQLTLEKSDIATPAYKMDKYFSVGTIWTSPYGDEVEYVGNNKVVWEGETMSYSRAASKCILKHEEKNVSRSGRDFWLYNGIKLMKYIDNLPSAMV